MVHNHRNVQGGTARAAIFGISDGLVSNVALIIGVAAADTGGSSVVIAGIAGLLAGASSMAAGEYVSVKAQSELIEFELDRERESIAEKPQLETRELAAIYTKRGIDENQALQMAEAVHDSVSTQARRGNQLRPPSAASLRSPSARSSRCCHGYLARAAERLLHRSFSAFSLPLGSGSLLPSSPVSPKFAPWLARSGLAVQHAF